MLPKRPAQLNLKFDESWQRFGDKISKNGAVQYDNFENVFVTKHLIQQ